MVLTSLAEISSCFPLSAVVNIILGFIISVTHTVKPFPLELPLIYCAPKPSGIHFGLFNTFYNRPGIATDARAQRNSMYAIKEDYWY